MTDQTKTPDRITVPWILGQKNSRRKLSALTAYDYLTARLVDSAGIDLILVGDSLGCVFQGHTNTLPVTLDEMIYHAKAVVRGVSRALVVGDLPFLSYQVSVEQALESAGRMLKESGVAAVKLEGGINVADRIQALTSMDIPVVGHVGLTPQSYHRMGGHKLQGTERGGNLEAGTYERVLEDAREVEAAGAFAVALEGIPQKLAREITDELEIPTIGIGAGPHCDGQILVTQDMLGMNPDFTPKFVKKFLDGKQQMVAAMKEYVAEVQDGEFPEDTLGNHKALKFSVVD